MGHLVLWGTVPTSTRARSLLQNLFVAVLQHQSGHHSSLNTHVHRASRVPFPAWRITSIKRPLTKFDRHRQRSTLAHPPSIGRLVGALTHNDQTPGNTLARRTRSFVAAAYVMPSPVGVHESLAPAEVFLRDHEPVQPMLVGPDPRGLRPVVGPDALPHVERRQAVAFPVRANGAQWRQQTENETWEKIAVFCARCNSHLILQSQRVHRLLTPLSGLE